MIIPSKIKKILVISLSNIGDIVLTFPVIDILREDFPAAEINVVIGPKGKEFFLENPNIHNFYIFNKRQSIRQMIRWVRHLRRESFDLVVDLRNTAIPFFMVSRHRTSFFLKRSKSGHMRTQHLERLKTIYPYKKEAEKRYCLVVPLNDRQYIDDIISKEIGEEKRFVVVAPGAADRGKRWTAQGFAAVCDYLSGSYGVKVVFAGDDHDRAVVKRVMEKMIQPQLALDLSGQTNLTQLAFLLKRSFFTIVNDSAPMHIASYLDVPTLALFGPTDPNKYASWSSKCRVVQKKTSCPVCQKIKGVKDHQCMNAIKVEDVLGAFEITPDGVIFKKL
jgi:ADP-heptose:LPS heptosyltransferase